MVPTILNMSAAKRIIKQNDLKIDHKALVLLETKVTDLLRQAVFRAKSNRRKTLLLRDV